MNELGPRLTLDIFKSTMRLGALMSAFYLGTTYHTMLARVERNTLYRNLHIEEGYFRDPEGLEILIRMNGRGNLVPSLYHRESGLRLPISNEVLEKYGEIKIIPR